jgi:DNA helicase II / ATP-dependent DNA helicase PcrA
MFLCSCAYMLQPLLAVLRRNGIPFHNPYRRSNGFWNPIRTSKRGSMANRILALLAGHPDYGDGYRFPWSHGELALWAELLEAKGVLCNGAKKRLSAYDPDTQVSMERFEEIFESATLESLARAYDCGYKDLLEWWRTRLTSGIAKRAVFPAEIASRHGPRALPQVPQVIVGTIHSVKGGQADVVFLFPDISQAGASQYAIAGASRDSVIRQFYVGVTRARERLYVCQPETALAVTI